MKVRHLKRNALPREYTGYSTQWIKRRRRKVKALAKSRRFAPLNLVWKYPPYDHFHLSR